ncbi:hypothetical protein THRCLA_09203 [Thraustotheca clavata]|uniref:Uncharacterized protein n=1 Tax=Thraustotheca clavata TaxID=74557 RepID=A0A1V9YYS4_9STRA|nr:hypothetical protein THRCLA_09203 [Thraustotheca clavata]
MSGNDGMKQMAEAMQFQINGVMQRVRESMEQSVGMSNMMSSMLENFLLQNLQIRSFIHAKPLCLELIIKNLGTIVVPVLSFTITLQSLNVSNASYKTVFQSLPADLNVQEEITQEIQLLVPELGQYNGQICLHCISPGTGNRLEIVHEFGVYYLQQLDIENTTRITQKVDCIAENLSTAKLRELFHLSPLQGLAITPNGGYVLFGLNKIPWFLATVQIVDGDQNACNVTLEVLTPCPIDVYTLREEFIQLATYKPRKLL